MGKKKKFYYAARINSFKDALQQGGLAKALACISRIHGITHVDLNYPDHFKNLSLKDISNMLCSYNLKLNGVAVRYYSYADFAGGAFSHPNPEVVEKAVSETCKAAELAQRLGGKVLTLWPGQDGFRYAFQLDYQAVWEQCMTCYQRVADKASIPISIEYKPDEPKSCLLIRDIGTTLLAIKDIARENVGVTLDFCHVLYAKEQPAYALALAARHTHILGVHLNDGYGYRDDGLITGTSNLFKSLEFLYQLGKLNYQGVVYFDTFPDGAEDPAQEVAVNVEITEKMISLLERLDETELGRMRRSQDGIGLQRYLWQMIFT